MRREVGFQMYHTVLFHHRADGGDAGLMAVIRKGDGCDGDGGALLESLQFVLKYIEAHLQMVGVYNTKQGFTRNGRCMKNGIELGHHSRDGCLYGTVGQLVFQLSEGGLGRVVATIDTGHFTDILRCLVEGSFV